MTASNHTGTGTDASTGTGTDTWRFVRRFESGAVVHLDVLHHAASIVWPRLPTHSAAIRPRL